MALNAGWMPAAGLLKGVDPESMAGPNDDSTDRGPALTVPAKRKSARTAVPNERPMRLSISNSIWQ
jgi:hypothetical protein